MEELLNESFSELPGTASEENLEKPSKEIFEQTVETPGGTTNGIFGRL